MEHSGNNFHKRITLAGSLIAIGIVFGDIGTSPLYTINSIFHNRAITETIALGSLSCIFWTLFFQTTLKYVIITLQADNNGEGGIFSLYALIRRYYGKWLIFPAMAGGAFLIADGIITPPISVASAVEGVHQVIPNFQTIPFVVAILAGLFVFQQFGTESIGKVFGPAMLIWFGFIAVIGTMALAKDFSVLRALNPLYAYHMLVEEPGGFWLLGSVFLCTTGAEALYSDMGHCGRNNIRISWIFIKITLVLCYAGQTAWLTGHIGQSIGDISPFYQIVPKVIYWPALFIATAATIIASQSLISGCFTLINEAIRLDIWPRHLVLFPGRLKGQLYIPVINWLLMCGCIGMVLYFKESTKMEAAFGLSVTLTMLMSTVLINFYLHSKRVPFIIVTLVTLLFLSIEISFLVANFKKIPEGGWITLLIGAFLFLVMFVWWKGKRTKAEVTVMVLVEKHIKLLERLSADNAIPKFSTNLAYLTLSPTNRRIEQSTIDSIFKAGIPKRADAYWFIHVNVTDYPYGARYTVDTLVNNRIFYVTFDFGFRIDPRIDYYFRHVIREMLENQEIDTAERRGSEYHNDPIGDFKFVVRTSFLSFDNQMPFWKNFLMKSFYNLKYFSVKEHQNYGVDESNLIVEKYPLVIDPFKEKSIIRSHRPKS